MADDEPAAPPSKKKEERPEPSAPRADAKEPARAEGEEKKPAARKKKAETKPAPRRPTLDPESARLLRVRSDLSGRRPKFVRQASHRYYRIGRWESWRRPRGLQSKQRRHYGYRSRIVRIGYGSPKVTRGLTPTGFKPVIVRTDAEVNGLDPARDAAVIARTVGTRRRLALEEICRKLGVHILNPIVKDREET